MPSLMMSGERVNDDFLLERFVRDHDPGAFRDLVLRHGPAVLRICRAVLLDQHEAEDAFQATFLVLVRKAGGIQDPAALGGWLRGVARCTAMEARRRAARRLAVETSRAQKVPADYVPEADTSELHQMLSEELARLPDYYREPVLLCYLEGLTHQEAAQRLGWPIGTVKTRLSRGRRLLRERLDRRKSVWGAALLFVLRGRGEVEAAVPEALVDSTVRAMTIAKFGRCLPPGRPFSRVFAVAEAMPIRAIALRAPWLWAVLVMASVLAGRGVFAVVGSHVPPAQRDEKGTVKTNVVDILTHACR
jgi:RNA polymerase sigma factor (sigma-70 family)